jgi:hypothetical protein
MRKLAIAIGVSVTMLLAGGMAWKADAMTWRSGTWNLPAAAKNYSPVETTACYGWGPYCPPGRHRVCGPWRCWCARC